MTRDQDQSRAARGQDARGTAGGTPALPEAAYDVCIDIGGMPILVRTGSAEFAHLLEDRYGSFAVGARPSADPSSHRPVLGDRKARACCPGRTQDPCPEFQLEVELVRSGTVSDAEEVRVRREGGHWVMERADFHAEWDVERRQGWVRQTANPYSMDAVLRILHSLILAREGGFLVHAASAVRKGRAFVFAGVSGAGKTTISRLAPSDVVLLTDEISYVREVGSQNSEGSSQKPEAGSEEQEARSTEEQPAAVVNPKSEMQNPKSYWAFGTPFAGELARVGENVRAPLAALYLLAQGLENRIEPVSAAEAARGLLRSILFFAQDAQLVRLVFQSVLDFVRHIPVRRLVFAPEAHVWELIA